MSIEVSLNRSDSLMDKHRSEGRSVGRSAGGERAGIKKTNRGIGKQQQNKQKKREELAVGKDH